MKLHKIIASAAVLLLGLGCQQVDKTCAYAPDQIKAPVLNEQSAVVVDENNLSSRISFTWTAVDYGYPAAVKYRLFGVYGDGEPYQIGESNSTTFTVTKEAFNNTLVNKKGLAVPEEATSALYMYLTASVSDTDPDYTFRSNTISFDVTTVKSTSAPWIRRVLYVPGAHQGWAPDAAPVLWETSENSNVYEGLVMIGDATDVTFTKDCEFKFTSNPGWDGTNYGDNLDALNTDGGAGNIKIAPGTYWLSVNTTTLKATAKPTVLSVIGAAIGGWEPANDVIMAPKGLPATISGIPTDEEKAAYETAFKAAINSQIFAGICETTVAGEFKFRFDQAWTTSWGGSLESVVLNGGNMQNTEEGRVEFSMNFKGDVGKIQEDSTNPWPYSGKVTKVTE